MEQQFIKERKRDRQRIERLQADQRIIIQRKAEDLLGHLRSPAEEPLEPTMAFSSSSGRNPLSSATAASRQPKVLRPVIPPKTLSHVKNGNVEFNYASETPSQHSNYLRPVTVQETVSKPKPHDVGFNIDVVITRNRIAIWFEEVNPAIW